MQHPLEFGVAVQLLTPTTDDRPTTNDRTATDIRTQADIRAEARLSCRPQAPYEIVLTLPLDGPEPLEWTLPRGLLTEGLFRACRQGGAEVRPVRRDGRRAVRLTLASPGGEVALEAPAGALGAWLERSLRELPYPAAARRRRPQPLPVWEDLLYPVPLPRRRGADADARPTRLGAPDRDGAGPRRQP
ncbi:SsgA family sporulation/cell division regulator [Streptomyces sp. NPDC092296]|uniref:SsgA family sporulation/cell division regulator n=1 Tax=Streptomyces sp. NPDC092296 TaxID=3366012 RepID=UPI00382AAC88